jgi:hypothetical protein
LKTGIGGNLDRGFESHPRRSLTEPQTTCYVDFLGPADGSYTRRMAEQQAAITGALGRTADPDAPDGPTPSSPTVRGLGLQVGFWILIVSGGIYTITTESWRHDDVFSVRAAFWAIVMINAVWHGWHRSRELHRLRSHKRVLPDRRG